MERLDRLPNPQLPRWNNLLGYQNTEITMDNKYLT